MTEKLSSTFTMEYKRDMKNTKKLNGTSMTEYKTDMSITKIDKYKKTEHDGFVIFCDFFTLVCVFLH